MLVLSLASRALSTESRRRRQIYAHVWSSIRPSWTWVRHMTKDHGMRGLSFTATCDARGTWRCGGAKRANCPSHICPNYAPRSSPFFTESTYTVVSLFRRYLIYTYIRRHLISSPATCSPPVVSASTPPVSG
ncbi:hypothetical protein CONPUDRAFT_138565 [Coniophora puteana RWD-64-598 SS2]|uniref:Uncharacterized protein n=1 Tax=Coniophora puteana (strain RWD-64-598) TaxID=741705 RepID=A0A5M3MGS8_CONPW|nr:uncharacterized protein CONPUDRAFT_138565 [Coniophora puteana RWD-64-598 SS2]EIW78150.1 hypothetical protein CONPUDRAFT_138565 [Coniophora puteana RWD-64-598 SS2]